MCSRSKAPSNPPIRASSPRSSACWQRNKQRVKVYAYQNCGTCRKAFKHLDKMGIDYLAIPIREQPPTKPELKRMLKIYHGDIRRLFNTSGEDYREMKLKDRLASMSEDQALDLLARNGGLVKRPF